MHHALLISEISQQICGALDHSCLPTVARTCRALHDPALDELWRDLRIGPFVRLLTQAQVKPGQSQQTSFEHPAWTTLRKYSTRTRSLQMYMMDDSSDFHWFLHHFNPPDPDSFFPNLRTLLWHPGNHLAVLPFFRLLCGTTLTSLFAEFTTDPASLAMIAALGVLCPNITDISISSPGEILSEALTDALSTSICHWKDLRRIVCDDLTASAIEHLSQVRDLESLTMCASGRMSLPPQFTTQELFFLRLRCLHLYSTRLLVETAYLRSFRLLLEEFRLDLFDSRDVFSSSSCLRDFFTTLTDACSHARLRRFHLYVIHPSFPPSTSIATIRDLQPLFSFINLRVVSFDGLSAFALDDDDIAVLAPAWPSIEELVLSTFIDHPIVPLPTFQSLFRLARFCPELRVLSLVIDATKLLTSSFRVVQSDVHSDILTELCLGNSPINAPIAVAHVLHTLYPTLEQVDSNVWHKAPLNHHFHRGRYEASWGTMNIHLQNLREKARETGESCEFHCVATVLIPK